MQSLSRVEREAETVVIRRQFRARQQGLTLTQEETDRIREQAMAVSELRNRLRETKSPLRDFAEDSKITMQDLEQVTVDAFKGMEDAFVEFVQTGKMSFTDLVQSIQKDLLQLTIRQNITGPLANILSQSGGFSGIFGGGTSGVATPGIAGPTVPAGAPPIAGGGFQHGGVVGGRPGRDKVPIMATRGEGVFTPEQMKSMGGRVQVVNNWNIQTPDADSFANRKTQSQISSKYGQAMHESMLRNGVRTRRQT